MELTSNMYVIEDIVKPTKAQLFKDLEVGDVLRFSLTIQRQGGGRRGLHATPVQVTEVRSEASRLVTMNNLWKLLDNYRLRPVSGC